MTDLRTFSACHGDSLTVSVKYLCCNPFTSIPSQNLQSYTQSLYSSSQGINFFITSHSFINSGPTPYPLTPIYLQPDSISWCLSTQHFQNFSCSCYLFDPLHAAYFKFQREDHWWEMAMFSGQDTLWFVYILQVNPPWISALPDPRARQ